MKKETRKARLRRLSYQVAEVVSASHDMGGAIPELDKLATAYTRGYRQAMTDLRRELARYEADGRPDEAFGGREIVVGKFLGGVR